MLRRCGKYYVTTTLDTNSNKQKKTHTCSRDGLQSLVISNAQSSLGTQQDNPCTVGPGAWLVFVPECAGISVFWWSPSVPAMEASHAESTLARILVTQCRRVDSALYPSACWLMHIALFQSSFYPVVVLSVYNGVCWCYTDNYAHGW